MHNRLALDSDEKQQNLQEAAMKINYYRKVLISFAKGEVLETNVGESRNIK